VGVKEFSGALLVDSSPAVPQRPLKRGRGSGSLHLQDPSAETHDTDKVFDDCASMHSLQSASTAGLLRADGNQVDQVKDRWIQKLDGYAQMEKGALGVQRYHALSFANKNMKTSAGKAVKAHCQFFDHCDRLFPTKLLLSSWPEIRESLTIVMERFGKLPDNVYIALVEKAGDSVVEATTVSSATSLLSAYHHMEPWQFGSTVFDPFAPRNGCLPIEFDKRMSIFMNIFVRKLIVNLFEDSEQRLPQIVEFTTMLLKHLEAIMESQEDIETVTMSAISGLSTSMRMIQLVAEFAQQKTSNVDGELVDVLDELSKTNTPSTRHRFEVEMYAAMMDNAFLAGIVRRIVRQKVSIKRSAADLETITDIAGQLESMDFKTGCERCIEGVLKHVPTINQNVGGGLAWGNVNDVVLEAVNCLRAKFNTLQEAGSLSERDRLDALNAFSKVLAEAGTCLPFDATIPTIQIEVGAVLAKATFEGKLAAARTFVELLTTNDVAEVSVAELKLHLSGFTGQLSPGDIKEEQLSTAMTKICNFAISQTPPATVSFMNNVKDLCDELMGRKLWKDSVAMKCFSALHVGATLRGLLREVPLRDPKNFSSFIVPEACEKLDLIMCIMKGRAELSAAISSLPTSDEYIMARECSGVLQESVDEAQGLIELVGEHSVVTAFAGAISLIECIANLAGGLPNGKHWLDGLAANQAAKWKPLFAHAQETIMTQGEVAGLKKHLIALDKACLGIFLQLGGSP
jgi:hypothetical protein